MRVYNFTHTMEWSYYKKHKYVFEIIQEDSRTTFRNKKLCVEDRVFYTTLVLAEPLESQCINTNFFFVFYIFLLTFMVAAFFFLIVSQ